MYELLGLLDEVLDLDISLSSGHVRIKPGVDAELDEKKRLYNGLPEILRPVAEEEVQSLPVFIDSCTIAYIPGCGYLLCTPTQSSPQFQHINYNNIPGLEFIFELDGVIHFKTRRCQELDVHLGKIMIYVLLNY